MASSPLRPAHSGAAGTSHFSGIGHWPRLQPRWIAGPLVCSALLTAGTLPLRAQGVDAIVKGFCLSAFDSEMARAGKVPPAGMADFACSCVAQSISAGTSLDRAQADCRLATTRRYPI